MDHALADVLKSMPAARRDELRELLRAEVAREQRRPSGDDALCFADLDEDDDALDDEDGFDTDSSRSAAPPLPPMSRHDARRAADAIVLAAMRRAGAWDGSASPRPPSPPSPESPHASAPRPSPAFLTRLSDVAPDRVRWLSAGRLAAGKITILDGDPGLGKSTLLCEFAARITRGQPLPGGQPGAPRNIVLMSAEDDLHDTIRPRIDAAGGDPERVVAFASMPVSAAAKRPFAIPGDVPFLEQVIQHVNAALVIVDPLVAFLDRRLSAHNDQDVRRALAALTDVGASTGAAIVAVRHLNKSAAANPLYRGGGSIGIIGAARCGLVLSADPDDPERRILAASKGNLARPPASLAFRLAPVSGAGVARVVWEGESPWTAVDLLRAAAEREPTSAVGEVRAWLRQALLPGPRPATEMTAEAAARGFSAAALRRARKAEGIEVRKARGRHGGWIWILPGAAGKGAHPTPSSAS